MFPKSERRRHENTKWHKSATIIDCIIHVLEGSDGLIDKVSASQPRDRGFEPYTGHDHDSSYDTSAGWFQEVGLKVI